MYVGMVNHVRVADWLTGRRYTFSLTAKKDLRLSDESMILFTFPDRIRHQNTCEYQKKIRVKLVNKHCIS